MQIKNLNIVPYSLGEDLSAIKDTLSYKGTYYYERFEVHEVIDKPINKLFNHLIDKIELLQFNNLLIGVIVYLKDDIGHYDSIKLNIDNELQVDGRLISTYRGLIHCWENDKEKLELVQEKNKLVITYSLMEYDI
jgi:hypothetical protein